MPPAYFRAAFGADRWFGLASLMCIFLLICVALTYRFKFAWLGAPVCGLLMIACWVRWVSYARTATRYAKMWYDSHPYTGPARRVLGPVRNFAVAQPILAGFIIGAAVMSILIIAVFQLVPANT